MFSAIRPRQESVHCTCCKKFFHRIFSSITDDSISSIHEEEALVTSQVVDSGTQRKLISCDGYTFIVKRQNSACTEWRCSVRNKTVTCPVTVVQRGDTYTVHKTHLHQSQPGIISTVQIQKEVNINAILNSKNSGGRCFKFDSVYKMLQ